MQKECSFLTSTDSESCSKVIPAGVIRPRTGQGSRSSCFGLIHSKSWIYSIRNVTERPKMSSKRTKIQHLSLKATILHKALSLIRKSERILFWGSQNGTSDAPVVNYCRPPFLMSYSCPLCAENNILLLKLSR